ncbi:MAG: DASS family sodium-coupled anion symporter [Candidatus Sericytochromatia bacterium]|nr:DASS family sodium-coupled anion symporter [Candidatus Sericytochromatia bacterium]
MADRETREASSGGWLLLAGGLALGTFWGLPYALEARKALALVAFVGLLWVTEALPLAVTALLVPVGALLLGFPGLTTPRALAPFADPVVFLFLGGFALAAALRVQGLDRKLAHGLLALARGHLGAAVALLVGATAVLSMWISNTATAAVMLPLARGLLAPLPAEPDGRTRAFVLLCVAYAASLGGLGTLVGSPPNVIAARAAGLDFASWLHVGLPLAGLLTPLMGLTLWAVLRPALSQRVASRPEPIPWTGPRLATAGVFVATALAWSLGGPWLQAAGLGHPDTLVALLALVALLSLRLLTWDELAARTDWGVLLLFGGGLALGELLGTSGAAAALGGELAQAAGVVGPGWMLLGITVFLVALSELASNTAAAALFVPLFAGLAPTLGLPRETVIVLVALAASCGFALPVATPPNALVYGTGEVPARAMLRAGLALDALCILVVTAWAWRALP